MSYFKPAVLFVLKSFVFSIVFICTAFILYALSSFNTPRKNVANENSIFTQEYNRQMAESAKMLDIQKELFRRSEANMTEQEKNTKRMSAILDLWERQAKRGK